MSNEIPDIVILTMFGTVVLILAAYHGFRALKAVWTLAKEMNSNLKKASHSLHGLVLLLQRIESELAYMRSMTQTSAGVQNLETQAQPPLGRAVHTTPVFPTPVWDRYERVPEAAKEDTDMDVLDETEEDVMAAQAREELRAKGIEPDEDQFPSQAVVEEA